MATYYASKNYVVALTRAIQKELKKEKSNVKISVVCPGPVKTEFNEVAGVKFCIRGVSSEYVAKYAIDQMLKGKGLILPSILIKCVKILVKIAPDNLVTEVSYHTQRSKNK